MESIGQKGELPHCVNGGELQTPKERLKNYIESSLKSPNRKGVNFISRKNFSKPATPPMRSALHHALLMLSGGFLFKITPPNWLLLESSSPLLYLLIVLSICPELHFSAIPY